MPQKSWVFTTHKPDQSIFKSLMQQHLSIYISISSQPEKLAQSIIIYYTATTHPTMSPTGCPALAPKVLWTSMSGRWCKDGPKFPANLLGEF